MTPGDRLASERFPRASQYHPEWVLADTLPDGWQYWLAWQRAVAPDNATEIKAVEADGGKYLGYVRMVGRRRGQAKLEEYCWPDTLRSFPPQYTKKPLLRSEEQ